MSRRQSKLKTIKNKEAERPSILSKGEFSFLEACNEVVALYNSMQKEKSYKLLEQLIAISPDSPNALNIKAKHLWKDGKYSQSIKAIGESFVSNPLFNETNQFIKFISQNAKSLGLDKELNELIDTIHKNESAILHNSMFNLIKSGEYDSAIKIYEENNGFETYGIETQILIIGAYGMIGDSETREKIFRKYSATANSDQKYRLDYAYGTSLMINSGIVTEESVTYYEHRKNYSDFKYPKWNGETKKGETKVLIVPAQGIGDEIKHCAYLEAVAENNIKFTLLSEPKLTPLFKRSLAKFNCDAFDFSEDLTKGDFDYQIEGSSLRYIAFKKHCKNAISKSYIQPNPEKTAEWKDKIDSIKKTNNATIAVGICWKSGNTYAFRNKCYPTLMDFIRILKIPNIMFFNTNYTKDSVFEIEKLHKETGIKIHNFPELDQKDDLDSTAAYLYNLDLVISVGTAVDELSASVGTRVWKIVNFTSDKECSMKINNLDIPGTYRISKRYDTDWSIPINIVKDKLEKYAKTGNYPELTT